MLLGLSRFTNALWSKISFSLLLQQMAHYSQMQLAVCHQTPVLIRNAPLRRHTTYRTSCGDRSQLQFARLCSYCLIPHHCFLFNTHIDSVVRFDVNT